MMALLGNNALVVSVSAKSESKYNSSSSVGSEFDYLEF